MNHHRQRSGARLVIALKIPQPLCLVEQRLVGLDGLVPGAGASPHRCRHHQVPKPLVRIAVGRRSALLQHHQRFIEPLRLDQRQLSRGLAQGPTQAEPIGRPPCALDGGERVRQPLLAREDLGQRNLGAAHRARTVRGLRCAQGFTGGSLVLRHFDLSAVGKRGAHPERIRLGDRQLVHPVPRGEQLGLAVVEPFGLGETARQPGDGSAPTERLLLRRGLAIGEDQGLGAPHVQRRVQRQRKISSSYSAQPRPTALSSSSIENGADRSPIHAAISNLPPDQRATIALHYLEGLSVTEISAALLVPSGTVKTRLMSARKNYAKHWKEKTMTDIDEE